MASTAPIWLDDMPDIFARLAALHPKKIDLSLGRLARVLRALDHPERRLPPVIHVAGTNGKGSVVAFLAALIKAKGLAAHIYTSPHLVRFNERIHLNGQAITDAQMSEFAERVEIANQSQPLTFFEAITATALLAFSEIKADFCLLETGLGGRFDATNIVPQPAMTIITPISYDHQAFLGDTLSEIAAEKAGIIKPRVPVVVAAQEAEALGVIKQAAAKMNSALFYQGEGFHITSGEGGWHYRDAAISVDLPLPCLAGAHQLVNAACALCALNHLGAGLRRSEIARALQRTRWPARLQPIRIAGRDVILDGGHNPAAGEALADFLRGGRPRRPRPRRPRHRAIYLICAMRATKSAQGFLAPLAPLIDRLYAIDLPAHQHVPGEGASGFAPEAIIAEAAKLDIAAERAASVEAALRRIPASPEPMILIAGSLLLAGDVLKKLERSF